MHDRCLGPSSNWEDATFASSKSEFNSPWFHEAGGCQFDSDAFTPIQDALAYGEAMWGLV